MQIERPYLLLLQELLDLLPLLPLLLLQGRREHHLLLELHQLLIELLLLLERQQGGRTRLLPSADATSLQVVEQRGVMPLRRAAAVVLARPLAANLQKVKSAACGEE